MNVQSTLSCERGTLYEVQNYFTTRPLITDVRI